MQVSVAKAECIIEAVMGYYTLYAITMYVYCVYSILEKGVNLYEHRFNHAVWGCNCVLITYGLSSKLACASMDVGLFMLYGINDNRK